MPSDDPVRVLRWVRKSKGSDDDVGLAEQRDATREVAESLTDPEHVDDLDLGVRTGFSRLSPRDVANPIDQDDRVQDALERVRAGVYDYIVAYDDRRVCRDDFLATIKLAMEDGDCEFAYCADVAEDDLTHDIHRRVERETKEEEIRKSKAALKRRRREGYDEGRPRWGTQYDGDNQYLEPDPETFDDALLAIALRRGDVDDGEASYRELVERTAIGSTYTAKKITERADWYLDLANIHGYEYPPDVAVVGDPDG